MRRKGNLPTIRFTLEFFRDFRKINVQKNTVSVWDHNCLDYLEMLEKSWLKNGNPLSVGKIKKKLLLLYNSQKGLMINKHFVTK